MDGIVNYWQRGLQHGDEQQEIGPATQLFEVTVVTFSAVLQVIADKPGYYGNSDGVLFYTALRDEFQNYYMWNEGFPCSKGDLDLILSRSKNLRATVLDLMAQWAKVVCRIPKVMPNYSWSDALPKFTELEVMSEKVSQIAEVAAKDVRSQFATRNPGDESDSDSDSDSSSTFSLVSLGGLEDILEDLKVYCGSLMELNPSLECPAIDFATMEEPNFTTTDDLLSVSEPARPFVLIIKDRFPSIDAGLVKKLGEANWQRRERLAQKLALNQRKSIISIGDSDTGSNTETVLDHVDRRRTKDILSSNYQSITTASNFSEPSLFDREPSNLHPKYQRRSIAESITSFATSAAEKDDNGQRRLPRLPSNHDFESPFQCMICGDLLSKISNRADWKRHVYADIEPYICLFTECNLGLHTFHSRREWIAHEFTVHRTEANWQCNLCADTFQEQEKLRDHIEQLHKLDLLSPQIGEVIAASKRLEMRDRDNEVCPFCLVVPARTQGSFAHHVGRHLQETSLAALPFLGSFSEGSSDDGNDVSDGGDNVSGGDEDIDDDTRHGDSMHANAAGNHESTEKSLQADRLPEDIEKWKSTNPVTERLREYKLVMLGRGGVGKSSLVNRLMLYRLVDDFDPFIEDAYGKKCLIDGEVAVLDVINTAGQEEYLTMREQHMKNGEGFMLVYSITSRRSFDEISKFQQEILRVKDQDYFPVIIVGNHCDRESERQVSREEGKRLAHSFLCPFLEVSARSPINVVEAFFDLVREIREYEKLVREVREYLLASNSPGESTMTSKEGESAGGYEVREYHLDPSIPKVIATTSKEGESAGESKPRSSRFNRLKDYLRRNR